MYDLIVYAYFANYIAKTFFAVGSYFASLMLSLATFGAGYLMRPVGALVLGSYINRKGRRIGLILTLGLMAIGTLTIAATPGYASIGIAAPIIVVIGRLLQGLSAGVELGGVSVYLAEIATPGNRGFYCSWQSASQQVAVIFTALLGVTLTAQSSAGGHGRMGLAHTDDHRLYDHSVHFHTAALTQGDGSFRKAQAPPYRQRSAAHRCR